MLLAALAVLILLVIGLNAASRRKAQDRFLSANEYWVYLPGDRMPDQNAVMTQVIGENRYKQRGRNPISPREGLLLSDIRLHMALVLRSKNPHVFRPDLFDDHVEPTAEILSALSDSQSLVKVRYVSEQPLKDRASVQLLPHLADTIAELGEGRVIYDCAMEILISKEDLEKMLSENLDLNQADLQVRAVWRRADRGGWAETRGLRKVGLPELATDQMEADEQVLVTEVLMEAAKKLWDANQLLEQVDVQLYEDEFRVIVSPPRNRVATVKILRVQSV
ncbi:MAG TPA: hypothetical protein VHE55_10235 [Fimbriimonadaceae bacterium]|nr:hypothetical protein [Fimbriimonadaceae bacterium]